MSTLEIVNDKENRMLSRREIVLNFKGGSGLVSRQSAADAIATKLGVAKENVKLVSLHGNFGVRDLRAVAYVYSDAKLITRHLPKYMMIRELSKEDRKKAREAAKLKPAAPQEPAKKA
ncbi:MAG: eS24 family ribosomal protein [Nitrososphaerales archaeon]